MQNFLFSLLCLSTTFMQSCRSAVVNCLALCRVEIHMLCLLRLAAVPHDKNEVIVQLIWGSKAFRMFVGFVNKMPFSLGRVVRHFFRKVLLFTIIESDAGLSPLFLCFHKRSAFCRLQQLPFPIQGFLFSFFPFEGFWIF